MAKGKRYEDAAKRYDRAHLHTPGEAIDVAKNLAKAHFDETVEVAFRLGVDPRKADQIVRGTVGLPSGTGREVRVAVFAAGEKAAEAREAGADVVGAEDLLEADPGRHARFRRRHRHARPDAARRPPRPGAGPPGPHAEPQDRHGHDRRRPGRRRSSRAAGSSTAPTATATSTCPSARSASRPTQLATNFQAVVDELNRAKPAAAKGRYMRKVVLSTTHGPGVKVDPAKVAAVES